MQTLSLPTNGELLNADQKINALEANKRLDQAAAKGHMTKEGEGWFKVACDPFCDVEQRVSGYPDGSNRQSIIQKLRKTVTVSAPSGVAGNWDLFVQNWPALISRAGYGVRATSDFGAPDTYVLTNCFLGDPTISGVRPCAQVGGLTWTSCAAGLNYWEQTSTVNTGHGTLDCSELITEALLTGASNPLLPIRCIAQGFEVQNLTAQLYKSGNLTAFRVPQPDIDEGWFFGKIENSEDPPVEFSGKFLPTLPNNSADAFKIPGSSQWPAAEGCYISNRLQSEENAPQVLTPVQLVVPFNRDPDLDSAPFFVVQNQHQVSLAGSPEVADIAILPNVLTPFDHTGVYLTGLTNQSVIQINVVWYLESFPNVSDTKLLVMSQISPPYDPVAIELYSHTVDRLPNAVPFGQNPLGEWFANVVDTLTDILPKALPIAGAAVSSIFPELAPVIVPMAAAAGVGVKRLVKKRRSQSVRNLPTIALPSSVPQPKTNVKAIKRKIKRDMARLKGKTVVERK